MQSISSGHTASDWSTRTCVMAANRFKLPQHAAVKIEFYLLWSLMISMTGQMMHGLDKGIRIAVCCEFTAVSEN